MAVLVHVVFLEALAAILSHDQFEFELEDHDKNTLADHVKDAVRAEMWSRFERAEPRAHMAVFGPGDLQIKWNQPIGEVVEVTVKVNDREPLDDSLVQSFFQPGMLAAGSGRRAGTRGWRPGERRSREQRGSGGGAGWRAPAGVRERDRHGRANVFFNVYIRCGPR